MEIASGRATLISVRQPATTPHCNFSGDRPVIDRTWNGMKSNAETDFTADRRVLEDMRFDPGINRSSDTRTRFSEPRDNTPGPISGRHRSRVAWNLQGARVCYVLA